jgi:hypothetical protein
MRVSHQSAPARKESPVSFISLHRARHIKALIAAYSLLQAILSRFRGFAGKLLRLGILKS